MFVLLKWFPFNRSSIFYVVRRLSDHRLSILLSTETLMDSTTATAELGWTVYPVSGSSDNSVSDALRFLHDLLSDNAHLIKLWFKQ